MYVAIVRKGFVPNVRRKVFEKLKGLETEACPFANLPENKRTQWALTREEMKNCHRSWDVNHRLGVWPIGIVVMILFLSVLIATTASPFSNPT